jgi:tRNA(adenine34) deaminase
VRQVKTESTFPPEGTFNRPAAEIARTLARKDVSPKGVGSGIRMIQYFINRGGKNLSASRRAELERAKRILQRKEASGKPAAGKRPARKPGARKGAARKTTRRSAARKPAVRKTARRSTARTRR